MSHRSRYLVLWIVVMATLCKIFELSFRFAIRSYEELRALPNYQHWAVIIAVATVLTLVGRWYWEGEDEELKMVNKEHGIK